MSERRPHTETELVELLRSIDVPAPQELHRRIDALVAEQAPRRGREAIADGRGWKRGGAVAALVAAAALVLVLVLSSGGSSSLSVRQTSALALLPATATAPPESRHAPGQLAVSVDDVAFPYWDGRFGWRSSGTRVDRVGGRTVRTVFYSNARGQRIGYAIVAGKPAPSTSGGMVVWRNGTPYRLLTEHGASAVAWLRNGRLCVITGRGVSSATLLALANWEGGGSAA